MVVVAARPDPRPRLRRIGGLRPVVMRDQVLEPGARGGGKLGRRLLGDGDLLLAALLVALEPPEQQLRDLPGTTQRRERAGLDHRRLERKLWLLAGQHVEVPRQLP